MNKEQIDSVANKALGLANEPDTNFKVCALLKDCAFTIKDLQSRLESLEQEKLKVYHIGEKTEELVFRRNGIQNVADMQAVFDAVEGALESLEKDAARYRLQKMFPALRVGEFHGKFRAECGSMILSDWMDSYDEAFDAAISAMKG